MNIQNIFNPDLALFGVITTDSSDPYTAVISYQNSLMEKLYGDFYGDGLSELLGKILNNSADVKNALNDLMANNEITIEGRLNDRDIKYHSKRSNSHIQAAIIDITELNRIKKIKDYSAGMLTRLITAIDETTGTHLDNMKTYSKRIAGLLGMDKTFQEDIYYNSPFHDIGKAWIRPSILKKDGALTKEEFEEMKKHTVYGAQIIGEGQEYSFAKDVALYHHENFDGSGYPKGLKGDEIPVHAQIVKSADIIDALLSKRQYKDSYTMEKTLDIIIIGDGRTMPNHFHPAILKVTKDNFENIISCGTG